jgi:hypothetical protein
MAEDDKIKVMQQDMHMVKNMLAEVVIYMKGAEAEVPESMRRFMNYFHDVRDIRYMHEESGMPVPLWIDREIERLFDRYRQLLEKQNSEDGAFAKVRREMASDPENRYDHTRLLVKPKELKHEARTGDNVETGRSEAGADRPRDLGVSGGAAGPNGPVPKAPAV